MGSKEKKISARIITISIRCFRARFNLIDKTSIIQFNIHKHIKQFE